MNDCIGCSNVFQENFPFFSSGHPVRDRRYFMESDCCIVQRGERYLEIFLCPLCGVNLREEGVRRSLEVEP